jgi:hypothetical protein
MSFRKHLTRQAPHLMLTFGLGLVLMFVAVYDELVWL